MIEDGQLQIPIPPESLEMVAARLVEENFNLLTNFLVHDNSFDYQQDADANIFLLFVLSHDLHELFDPNINYYLKLFNPNEESLNISEEIIFIKFLKDGLRRLLLDRVHVNEVLDKYKDNNLLITIGSLKTGFFPFHRITVDYRKIQNVDMVYQGWLRFFTFRNYRVLSFCEQVFSVAILNRNMTPTFHRWALIHPKSSNLLHPLHYIGLYGISGVNMAVRRAVKNHVGNMCYNNYLKSSSSSSVVTNNSSSILTQLTGTCFGPKDIPSSYVKQLIEKKIPTSPVQMDLLDLFINNFVPYLNDTDNNIIGKEKWTKENIFDNNVLLYDGKIYGLIFTKTNDNVINVKFDDDAHLTLLSEDNKYFFNKFFTHGREGEVFVPLIPIKGSDGLTIIGFQYPDNYKNDATFELPDISNITEIFTNYKVLVLHIYNFIISYFLGYDYLNIISSLRLHYENKIYSFVHSYHDNSVTYNLPSCDESGEINRCRAYCWITVKVEGHVCPLPLIIWVLYHHSMQYACGIPLHPQIFFDYKLKCDRCGVYSSSGVNYEVDTI